MGRRKAYKKPKRFKRTSPKITAGLQTPGRSLSKLLKSTIYTAIAGAWLAVLIYTASVERYVSHKIADVVEADTIAPEQIANATGVVHVLRSDAIFTEPQIQKYIDSYAKEHYSSFMLWNDDKANVVTGSALGLDNKHHFSNSYLIGFAPFEADKMWIPLYTLSKKLTYQYDEKQYNGLLDVWQNSKQAFFNTRGDCEDHAIALSDWLIEMGFDARVAVGTYKSEGHAWVIVFKEGKEYLLEATEKSKSAVWTNYPLARLQSNYRPEYMFNREYFWVNSGSRYTTRYSGNHWRKVSRYKGSTLAL